MAAKTKAVVTSEINPIRCTRSEFQTVRSGRGFKTSTKRNSNYSMASQQGSVVCRVLICCFLIVSSTWPAGTVAQTLDLTPTPTSTSASGRGHSATLGPVLEQLVKGESRRLARGGQTANTSASCDNGFSNAMLGTGLVLGVVGGILAAHGFSEQNKANNSKAFGGVALGVGLGLVLIGISERHWGCNKPSKAARVAAPPQTGAETISADDQMARTAIDQIRGGAHGEIPPAQAVGTNPGGVTTTSVRNGTQYTLYFYIAGPVARSLEISPGQTQELRLVPGRYEVGARVSAQNVTPFYGVQNYGQGTAYSETFYIRAQ